MVLATQGRRPARRARPGRLRSSDSKRVAIVGQFVLHTKPESRGAGIVRRTAGAEDILESTVQCCFALFGFRPHLTGAFKLSVEPFLVESVREISALLPDPPERAIAICADDKTPIQVPDRAQPVLPIRLDDAGGDTHGHVHRGSTTPSQSASRRASAPLPGAPDSTFGPAGGNPCEA